MKTRWHNKAKFANLPSDYKQTKTENNFMNKIIISFYYCSSVA